MNNANIEEIKRVLEIGIKRGRKAKRKQKIINSNIIAVMLIALIFSVSVNVSSTFASSLIDLPVIGKIVDFIRVGSGFKEVAERGLYVSGDTIIKDDDYELSIDGYYYSDNNLNIILRLDGNLDDNRNYMFDNVEVLSVDFVKLSGNSIDYGRFNKEKDYAISIINISMEDLLPEDVVLRFNITNNLIGEAISIYDDTTGKIEDEYLFEQLEVHLEKQVKELNRTFSINKKIEGHDIQIDFKELVVTPTTMNLKVDIKTDSMRFYDFETIYFESKNKTYQIISGGKTRSGNQENGYTYYFKSNYFDGEPLTLVIEGILALPVNQSTIVIDLDTNEIVSTIDEKLTLMKVKENKNSYFLHLTSSLDEDFGFSKYDGNYFKSSATMTDDKIKEYVLELDKSLVKNSEIEIDFWKYPHLLQFNESIEIGQ